MSLFIQHDKVTVPCITVKQPIGEFYLAAIPYDFLVDLCYSDVRRMEQEDRDFEKYLGIQRPLSNKRMRELQQFVNTADACFPGSVIIAIDGRSVVLENGQLTISGYLDEESDKRVRFSDLARVIDGQHRIAGLEGLREGVFDVPVTIFVDVDIADQAYIFSTVNLAQTKVSRSLAYDLYDLAHSRSPQKTCHHIAIALDKMEGGPFFKRIKRLGASTHGRQFETITQASMVEGLMPYISNDPVADRDKYLRGKRLDKAQPHEKSRLIFRDLFVEEKDLDIAEIVFSYFSAVRARWPLAWDSQDQGRMLNKTNGFKALIRFLGDAYNFCLRQGLRPTEESFLQIFSKIELGDDDFNVDNYKPGSSGQGKLYNDLKLYLGDTKA